jgi:transcriptional regulator with XRE-family HTH domain
VQVAENLRRLRSARGLSTSRLSKLLADFGRPIQPTGITKIEKRERKVDVDDLVALAAALRVNPSALLLPPTIAGEIELTGVGVVPADVAWRWADGEGPIGPVGEGDRYSAVFLDFLLHARPEGRRDLAVE